MDIEAIRAASYTRAQVADLTGLDDSTLNYWMREGVLRASSGGGGKGQHRRFPYHQVNLALLLDRLRDFGVGLPALKSLSAKFHDALEFMSNNDITTDNSERVFDAILVRRRVLRDKSFTIQISPELFPLLVEACPWVASKELEQSVGMYPRLSIQADLDEAYDYHLNIPRVHQATRRARMAQDEIDYGPFGIAEVALAKAIDLPQYEKAEKYWSSLTAIGNAERGNYETSNTLFYRNVLGDWEVEYDPSNLPQGVHSFVGINLNQITFHAWNRA